MEVFSTAPEEVNMYGKDCKGKPLVNPLSPANVLNATDIQAMVCATYTGAGAFTETEIDCDSNSYGDGSGNGTMNSIDNSSDNRCCNRNGNRSDEEGGVSNMVRVINRFYLSSSGTVTMRRMLY